MHPCRLSSIIELHNAILSVWTQRAKCDDEPRYMIYEEKSRISEHRNHSTTLYGVELCGYVRKDDAALIYLSQLYF